MGNTTLIIGAWIAVAVHATAGFVVVRRITALPVLPVVNALVALGLLAYWVPKWQAYATGNISWYMSDQVVPLYALVVLVLSGAALAGRISAPAPVWIVFSIDLLAILGMALFLTFFRMDRLI